jgi:hypothetical protein
LSCRHLIGHPDWAGDTERSTVCRAQRAIEWLNGDRVDKRAVLLLALDRPTRLTLHDLCVAVAATMADDGTIDQQMAAMGHDRVVVETDLGPEGWFVIDSVPR